MSVKYTKYFLCVNFARISLYQL